MNETREINATVKFFATLRRAAPAKKNITLLVGSTINTILDMFDIPKETKLIILINGVPHQTRETIVKNGDIVAIFPPLAGG
jgi:molybdopterin converting factor small subunit